ncbi:MAG: tripartite tricarboxylate transporter substrate binding protein [Betaproteobacteria bacterium]|nr:tripartite tricarboxylate transporter substrate binding protein [Betaproteobacteria bacterium]
MSPANSHSLLHHMTSCIASALVGRIAAIALSLALALSLSDGVMAQSFPERPIKIVVPWPAGGITDSAGRIMAQRLTERFGTAVVVENRAGAAGTIGAEAVARAQPDGYTLLLASAETHAIAPSLRARLPYDPSKDFAAIAPFAINPFALVSRPDFPANDLRELIATIKAQSGKFTYSSAGLGSTSQIAMETLKGLAGIDVLHVPFQGQAPAMTSLMGGQTDLQMLPAGSAQTMSASGKIKVFAVTTHARFFNLPEVPAMKELGYEAMNFANFFGLVAPAAVPAGVLQRLTQEVAAVAQAPDTRAALRKLGVDSYPAMTASDFQRFLEEERQRWGTVIRGLGLKPE